MKSLAGKHHSGFHQFFVEFPHCSQDLPAGHDACFTVLIGLDDYHESHRDSPYELCIKSGVCSFPGSIRRRMTGCGIDSRDGSLGKTFSRRASNLISILPARGNHARGWLPRPGSKAGSPGQQNSPPSRNSGKWFRCSPCRQRKLAGSRKPAERTSRRAGYDRRCSGSLLRRVWGRAGPTSAERCEASRRPPPEAGLRPRSQREGSPESPAASAGLVSISLSYC